MRSIKFSTASMRIDLSMSSSIKMKVVVNVCWLTNRRLQEGCLSPLGNSWHKLRSGKATKDYMLEAICSAYETETHPRLVETRIGHRI